MAGANEQIVLPLPWAESGTAVVKICWEFGITKNTSCRWKRHFAGLHASEVPELRQLRDENRKLNQLLAELSLDKTTSREALAKDVISPIHTR